LVGKDWKTRKDTDLWFGLGFFFCEIKHINVDEKNVMDSYPSFPGLG
jgi:hypothetical protein